MDRIEAKGPWGTVEWALDRHGKMPAKEFFDSLPREDKAKVLSLFGLLSRTGRIRNREKFKKLGDRGGRKYSHLWEFKSFQIRFLGIFQSNRFIVANGIRKKSRDLPRGGLDKTLRILEENKEQEKNTRK